MLYCLSLKTRIHGLCFLTDNYGLNLTVKLSNKVSLSNPSTEQYRIKEVMGEGAGSTEDEPFIIGNVTFISIAKLRSGYSKKVKYYYECIIRGPYFEEAISTQQHNWTMEFLETGNYSFTVHAIAVLNQALAHHAEFTGKFTILGKRHTCGYSRLCCGRKCGSLTILSIINFYSAQCMSVSHDVVIHVHWVASCLQGLIQRM